MHDSHIGVHVAFRRPGLAFPCRESPHPRFNQIGMRVPPGRVSCMENWNSARPHPKVPELILLGTEVSQ
jgi:hypothetical protein